MGNPTLFTGLPQTKGCPGHAGNEPTVWGDVSAKGAAKPTHCSREFCAFASILCVLICKADSAFAHFFGRRSAYLDTPSAA